MNFVFAIAISSLIYRRFLDAYQYAIDLNHALHGVLRARAVSSLSVSSRIDLHDGTWT